MPVNPDQIDAFGWCLGSYQSCLVALYLTLRQFRARQYMPFICHALGPSSLLFCFLCLRIRLLADNRISGITCMRQPVLVACQAREIRIVAPDGGIDRSLQARLRLLELAQPAVEFTD